MNKLSIPARILFWPWKIVNLPVYALSRYIRKHSQKGSFLWQFAGFTPIRVSIVVVLVGTVFLLSPHHWIAGSIAGLIEEYWRAMLVYPVAEATGSFFINTESAVIAAAEEL